MSCVACVADLHHGSLVFGLAHPQQQLTGDDVRPLVLFLFERAGVAWPYRPLAAHPAATPMRTLNYIFSVISIVLGIALILFMLIQSTDFNIGVAIGIVLVLNGAVRLWFAQDDH